MIDPSDLLLLWKPGDPRGTFTRATAGTYIDQDGRIQSAISGAQRNNHWVNGLRTAFFESARTQVAANPQAPNSWTAYGSPVITTTQTDPFGGTTAILVEDNDGAAVEGKLTACTFTGNATKCVAAIVRPGTATAIFLILRDATAGANRHSVSVTWNGGTTAPTLATDEGAGTLFTPVALYDSAGALWWLIAFSATSVVAANTNNLMAVGPSAGTGTFYLAGGNAWDATYPTSWQGASLGTRNADQLFLAETIPAQPLACYVHFVEEEPSPFIAQPGGGNFAGQFLTLGGTNAHWLRLDKVATGGTYRIIHQHGAGNFVQDNIDLNPDVGDGVELVGYLYADGSVQLTGRKNGGAVTTGTRSAALQTPSLFADTDVHLGGIDADGGACVGLAAVAVVDGAPAFDDLTLAVCSPYLAFEDDIGEAALVAGVPVLNGWRPDVDKIGDAVERLSDGTRYLFQFRRDYLAEFTVPLLAPSQLTVALRLKEHLLDGGTVTVITSDRDFSAYGCILAPGTEPAVEFADPAVLDYAFRVTLKNTADVPLLARYR